MVLEDGNADTLASLQGAGYPPEIWTPDAATERKRRLWRGVTSSCGIARGSERGAFDPARSTIAPAVHFFQIKEQFGVLGF